LPQPFLSASVVTEMALDSTSICLVFSVPSMVSTLPTPIQVTLSAKPMLSMK